VDGETKGKRNELSKNLAEVESKIARSMKTLMEGELKDIAQAGIVRELLSGSRTSSELVESLYGLKRGDEGFQSYYTKIRREIADLESRGFVSRRLFGRERPYRLTQLAVVKLTRMADLAPTWSTRLITRIDLIAYLAALSLAGTCALVSTHGIDLPASRWFALLLTSTFLTGIAFTRFVQMLKKVI